MALLSDAAAAAIVIFIRDLATPVVTIMSLSDREFLHYSILWRHGGAMAAV